MPQQMQNPIAAQIAAAPNQFSATEAYDRENGRADTAQFTQVSSPAVDPYKMPAPTQQKPYRTTYRMDGEEGEGR